jgi:hypothetical protein
VDRRLLAFVLVAMGLGGLVGYLVAGATRPETTPRMCPEPSSTDVAHDPANPSQSGPEIGDAEDPLAGEFPASACQAPSPCPSCPPPVSCPTCPERRCPPAETVCSSHTRIIAELRRSVEAFQGDLDACRTDGPKGRYKGTTAHDRRVLAAQDKSLLLEFPSWGEELSLPPERVEKFGLAPEEEQALEEIYRKFHTGTHEGLRQLYAELVGDPDAGQDSTINALIHNIMGLSPREHCQERILEILSILSSGGGLPGLTPESSACEQAIWMLFVGVDALDQEVSEKLGKVALDALWSGTSSFTYSTASSPPAAPPPE